MKEVKADLHLHTCLSPCGDFRMQPTAIIKQAKKAKLDMIGICDHNSAENVTAVIKAGQREGVPVIPGIEITSREEVHILGWFKTVSDLMHLQNMVYENLTGKNNEKTFGSQTIVDEWDRTVGTNRKLLIGATSLSVERVVEAIHHRGGLAIASHIDRERFSLIGQLGFIPEGLRLDALEVSSRSSIKQWNNFPIVMFSDAHFLGDIGKRSTGFVVEDTSLNEIEKALRQEEGREVIIH